MQTLTDSVSGLLQTAITVKCLLSLYGSCPHLLRPSETLRSGLSRWWWWCIMLLTCYMKQTNLLESLQKGGKIIEFMSVTTAVSLQQSLNQVPYISLNFKRNNSSIV